MPITVDALVLGLTAGCKSFNSNDLQFTGFSSPLVTNQLAIQVYSSAVTTGLNLQSGCETNATFTTPADITSGNFKVKSYLSAPVVCPIATSGTATKIAFALRAPVAGTASLGVGATEADKFTHGFGNTSVIPTYSSLDTSNDEYGDIFMVITMSPGIAVTAGGYLTVKGYDAGVVGSDSFTYITLESGS